MAAKEIGRRIDRAHHCIVVDIDDGHGNLSKVQIYVRQERCPHCGRPYAKHPAKAIDVDQHVKAHCKTLDEGHRILNQHERKRKHTAGAARGNPISTKAPGRKAKK